MGRLLRCVLQWTSLVLVEWSVDDFAGMQVKRLKINKEKLDLVALCFVLSKEVGDSGGEEFNSVRDRLVIAKAFFQWEDSKTFQNQSRPECLVIKYQLPDAVTSIARRCITSI